MNDHTNGKMMQLPQFGFWRKRFDNCMQRLDKV